MSQFFTTKKEIRTVLKETNHAIEKWVVMKSTSPNLADLGFCEAALEEQVATREKLLKILKFWSKDRNFKRNFDRIMQAKEFPVNELIQFNRGGFAKCIAHGETTPSLKYYPKTNTCFCFSCSKTFDSIEIVRVLYGKSFLEAISYLIGHDN